MGNVKNVVKNTFFLSSGRLIIKNVLDIILKSKNYNLLKETKGFVVRMIALLQTI